MQHRIEVDYDLCESNGLCEDVAPQVFRVEDDDTLTVLVDFVADDDLDDVQRAIDRCPKQALRLVDDQ